MKDIRGHPCLSLGSEHEVGWSQGPAQQRCNGSALFHLSQPHTFLLVGVGMVTREGSHLV